jgi:hypothetical protein
MEYGSAINQRMNQAKWVRQLLSQVETLPASFLRLVGIAQ